MRGGITGHRGLSTQVEEQVRALLTAQVEAYGTGGLVDVSCIADGTDSWFAETVLQHGGRLEVVIPATEYRQALPDWHQCVYDRLISRAADVHHTRITESTCAAHQAGSEILIGLADELIAVGTENLRGDTEAPRTSWRTPSGPASRCGCCGPRAPADDGSSELNDQRTSCRRLFPRHRPR